MPLDNRISNAWLKAAADLGIKVVAPFMVADGKGREYWFEACVVEFGSSKGTIVGNLNDNFTDLLKEQNFYYSRLSPSYATYNRQHFIGTLNDWGWFGEKDKEPDWYTGQPSTKTH